MKKKITQIPEGDLLFEERFKLTDFLQHFVLGISIFYIWFIVAFSKDISRIVFRFEFNFNDDYLTILTFILTPFIFYLFILALKKAYRDDSVDNTYKVYCFSDKLVVYEKSKLLNKKYLSKHRELKDMGLSIEICEEKLNELKKEINQISEIMLWEKRLSEMRKGDAILEHRLKKDGEYIHKNELTFNDIKYFTNDGDGIQITFSAESGEHEDRLMKMADKYKKHKLEIVEILNNRIKAAKASATTT